MRPRTDGQTDRHIHTDTQTRVTNIHLASATPHAKCIVVYLCSTMFAYAHQTTRNQYDVLLESYPFE